MEFIATLKKIGSCRVRYNLQRGSLVSPNVESPKAGHMLELGDPEHQHKAYRAYPRALRHHRRSPESPREVWGLYGSPASYIFRCP